MGEVLVSGKEGAPRLDRHLVHCPVSDSLGDLGRILALCFEKMDDGDVEIFVDEKPEASRLWQEG